ncbi:MAG: hypothetical protein ABFS45_12115 [Pseudomonadota bacterium]
MTEYRSVKVKGASYFPTANCAARHGNQLLVEHINLLLRFSEGRRMTQSTQ